MLLIIQVINSFCRQIEEFGEGRTRDPKVVRCVLITFIHCSVEFQKLGEKE